MNDFIVSLIRTWVPIGVGVVLTWVGAQLGITIDSTETAMALTGLIIAIYYGVVRWVEGHYPNIGIMLGKKQAPSYSADDRT